MGSRGKSHITEVTMTNNNQPNYQKHTEYDTIAAYSWKSHQKYNEYTEYWGEEILCYSRENGFFLHIQNGIVDCVPVLESMESVPLSEAEANRWLARHGLVLTVTEETARQNLEHFRKNQREADLPDFDRF